MMTVLKFIADWCQPCKEMEEVLKDLPFSLTTVDVDEEPKCAEAYEVVSLPTFIFKTDSVELERIVGTCSKDKLINTYNKYQDEIN